MEASVLYSSIKKQFEEELGRKLRAEENKFIAEMLRKQWLENRLSQN